MELIRLYWPISEVSRHRDHRVPGDGEDPYRARRRVHVDDLDHVAALSVGGHAKGLLLRWRVARPGVGPDDQHVERLAHG